ncbi:histone chaperone [Dimargaris cristalligena]|nr:histone chaperone [Dimargaris cristalligena]
MERTSPQGVNIKSQDKKDDFIAPTPHNTPIVTAPIHNRQHTSTTMAGSFTPNAQLVSDLQGKLGSLIGAPTGYIESLPASVQRRLDGLKCYQSEHAKLETEFHKEIFALEKKYLGLYKPLYEKRSQVVNGSLEPTDAEVEAGKKVDADSDDEAEEEPAAKADDADSPVTGVPEFWLTCMKNHGQIDELISDRDQEALKHLTDITLEYLEDEHAFRLVFTFAPNEFFTNTKLTKTYFYQTNPSIGDIVFDHAEGDSINWNEGKDLTMAVESRKQRNKSTNETRVVKKNIPTESFFGFFDTIAIPEAPEEEDELDLLQDQIEADYEIGEEFKEKIIPHAVDWFTGKALEYEGLNYDDFEEDGEDFYGEESDDDDDDEI